MGEMEGWMDENFIKNIFQTVLGESVQVKVIRDRNSGYVQHLFLEHILKPCNSLPGCPTSLCLKHPHTLLCPAGFSSPHLFSGLLLFAYWPASLTGQLHKSLIFIAVLPRRSRGASFGASS
jgi:hypothetical protein